MKIQRMNAKTKSIALTATTKHMDLSLIKGSTLHAICYNGSDKPVLVVNQQSASNISFPIADGAQVFGQIIPPGLVMTYEINEQDTHLSAIQSEAGSGNLYVTVGEGV